MKKGTYLTIIFLLAFLLSIAGIGNASIVNGGFETGDLTGWKTGIVSDSVSVVGDDYPFASPNGSYMCRLGSAYKSRFDAQPPGPNEISQTFTVTEDNLNFAYCLFTYDYGGYDDFQYQVTLEVDGTIIKKYQQTAWGSGTNLKTTGWQVVSVDVSIYMGQELTLYFTAGGTVDMVNGFWAYIDDGPGGVYLKPSLEIYPSYQDVPIGSECSLGANVYDGYGIGVPNVPVTFLVVSGPNTGTTGSAVTDDYGSTWFSYLGNTFGLDTINVWCDMDGDGVWDPDEVGNVANVNWLDPNQPAYFYINPYYAAPPVGNEHSLQATVYNMYWMPTVGIPIVFQIVSGPHIGTAYTGVTDDAGIASFSYMGIASGVDVVHIWCDMDGDGMWDPEELGSWAGVFWINPLRAIGYNEDGKMQMTKSPKKGDPSFNIDLYMKMENSTIVPSEIPFPEFFAAYNVTALVVGNPDYVRVNEGEAILGDILPGTSVLSKDTFSLNINPGKQHNPDEQVYFDVMYYDYFGNMHIITNVPMFADKKGWGFFVQQNSK